MLTNVISRLLIVLVKGYRRFLSPLSINACRYYPTCSQYALWLLIFDNPFLALYKIFRRIFTCNQLFSGGIDYPQARIRFKYVALGKNIPTHCIKYWFIPTTNKTFLGIISPFKQTYNMQVYIIKSFH